jgi:protein phosphatase 1 regulatory subunit 32
MVLELCFCRVYIKWFPVFSVDISNKIVGDPEGTGYTHAYNVEPITYIPADPHKNDRPVS